MRIAIVGAGAWGTALAVALSGAHEVRLWARDADQRERLRTARESVYLPGVAVADAVVIAPSFDAAVAASELVLIVTPTSALDEVLVQLNANGIAVPIVWACKGLDQASGMLAHERVERAVGRRRPGGILSGPSFALEVARGLPTALTLASRDETFAAETARQLHRPNLRVYFSTDLVGVELGGALKNVMAIATGIADGLGLGMNARAALITRGLAEMTRLGLALGGRLETFMGLAGVGDLILTCTGDLSRNRRVGLALAEGRALPDILAQLGHVAEGVRTAGAIDRIAGEHAIDMPITRAVCAVLFEGLAPRTAVEQLLARDPRSEAPAEMSGRS